jgi:hypothetical protein
VGDPVSWFLIRPGWTVVAADGTKIGKVDEVAGDEDHDIFDGLVVSTSALGKPRYVPAEQVGSIEEGTIRLSLDREAAQRLDEYAEPATQARIEPGGGRFAGAFRSVESMVDRPDSHPHPVRFLERVAYFFRRLRG